MGGLDKFADMLVEQLGTYKIRINYLEEKDRKQEAVQLAVSGDKVLVLYVGGVSSGWVDFSRKEGVEPL